MLLRVASRLYFLAVLTPVSAVRKLRKSSPFGEKAYRAPSAWDR
ncbi:MAG: hypothetical protein ABIQ09_02910 [Jatrophihabitantaceae bacterium]